MRVVGYVASVRKGLAALLFVLIAGLAAADPLACPDGCTNEALPQTVEHVARCSERGGTV